MKKSFARMRILISENDIYETEVVYENFIRCRRSGR